MKFNFKIRLIGDANVGKSTTLGRWSTGDFIPNSSEKIKIELNTTAGQCTFEIYAVLRETNYIEEDTDCTFDIFDVTNMTSFESSMRAVHTTPAIYLGNKIDKRDRVVLPHMIRKFPYYDFSAKANYNLYTPFLKCFRDLIKNDNIMWKNE